MILVSACLLGCKVRYKGDGKPIALLMKYKESGHFIPFCPECRGGLPTPRPASEITGGSGADVHKGKARVINKEGRDVTREFTGGARKALETCRKYGIKTAILKSRSPSCSPRAIYDGTFSGRVREGEGVTAALLRDALITLYSEEDLTEELLSGLIEADKEILP